MLNIVVIQETLESKKETKALFPNICKAIKEIAVSDDVFIHTLADQSLSPKLVEWCLEESIPIKVYPFRANFNIAAWGCNYNWWGRKSYALPMNKIKGDVNELGLLVSAEFKVKTKISLKDIFGSSIPPRGRANLIMPNTESLRIMAAHIDSFKSKSSYGGASIPKDYIILEASLSGRTFVSSKGDRLPSWTVSDKKISRQPLPKKSTHSHLEVDHNNIINTIISFEKTIKNNEIYPYEINKFRCLISLVIGHVGFITGRSIDIMKAADNDVNQMAIANFEAKYKLFKPLFTGEDIISLDTDQFDMTIRNKLIQGIYWVLDNEYCKERKDIIKLLTSDKDIYEAWRPECGKYTFLASNDEATTKIHSVAKFSKHYSLASNPNKIIPLSDELLPKIKLHSK